MATQLGNKRLFNNAAQAWNHSFFWQSMSPKRDQPSMKLSSAIEKKFGGLAQLKASFVEAGAAHFASGWVWLEVDPAGMVCVRSSHDAENILSELGTTPLLVCDLWEHAYYLDHQNNRRSFPEAWVYSLANWTLANSQFEAAHGHLAAWRHPLPIANPVHG
jgi:Fe-Mn family superoxide dismutase